MEQDVRREREPVPEKGGVSRRMSDWVVTHSGGAAGRRGCHPPSSAVTVPGPGDSGDVVKRALQGFFWGPLKKLALAAFLVLLLAAVSSADEFERKVTWVVDGDSFKFQVRVLDVTVEDECRMLGYNAPEMTGEERLMGRRAKGKLIDLIAGETVRISTEKRDRYGRNLCDVWLRDGTHVNEVMRKWLEEAGYGDVDKYRQMER
jgi:hypothetical protein